MTVAAATIKTSPQVTADERPTPANMAVWILIWAELSEFALFFIIYLVVRAHNPELFSEGPMRLNTVAGALNTLTLLSSSYCVARAMFAMRSGRRKKCLKWLALTLAMGLTYCGIKVWEYQWNGAQGIDSRTDLFFYPLLLFDL